MSKLPFDNSAFLFAGLVAALLLNSWAIVTAWLLGIGLIACQIFCLEPARNYGGRVHFLFAWADFLVIGTTRVCIPAIAFAGFFAAFLGLDAASSEELRRPLAIALISLLSLVHMVHTQPRNMGLPLQLALAACVMLAAALFLVGYFNLHVINVHRRTHLPENLQGIFAISARLCSAVPVLWSLDPNWLRQDGSSIHQRGSRFFAMAALSLAVNASILLVLSPSELASVGSFAVVTTLKRSLGAQVEPTALFVLMLLMLFDLSNRIGRAQPPPPKDAKSESLFHWLSQRNPLTSTPQRAIIVQGGAAIFTILVFDDIYSLLFYAAIPLLLKIAASAILQLKTQTPKLPAWLLLAASAVISVSVCIEYSRPAGLALLMCLLGLAVYPLQGLISRGGKSSSE